MLIQSHILFYLLYHFVKISVWGLESQCVEYAWTHTPTPGEPEENSVDVEKYIKCYDSASFSVVLHSVVMHSTILLKYAVISSGTVGSK